MSYTQQMQEASTNQACKPAGTRGWFAPGRENRREQARKLADRLQKEAPSKQGEVTVGF
jgi:hypothetical protein